MSTDKYVVTSPGLDDNVCITISRDQLRQLVHESLFQGIIASQRIEGEKIPAPLCLELQEVLAEDTGIRTMTDSYIDQIST